MGRFYGEVGYGTTVEEPVSSGVWVDNIIEYSYFGDVVRNTRKLDDNDSVNGTISVNMSISIVADEYALEHFFNIKYLRWAEVLWTISSVEVQRPRLILSLGSVYNGPTA